MTDSAAIASNSAAQPVDPPLSQWQRLIDVFIAPSKTFTDILRDRSWWLPFVLTAIVSYGFTYTVQKQIGWEHVAENTIQQSPKQQERIAAMTPQQAAALKTGMSRTFEYSAYVFPLISLVLAAIVSAVLVGTMNFVFSGQAAFGQMMAVYFYATFPLNLKYLLAIAVLFAVDSAQFRLQNPLGSNLGYYLSPDASPWWIALATRIDIFTLWDLILFSMGAAIVARVRGREGAKAIFGWWILLTLITVAWLAVKG